MKRKPALVYWDSCVYISAIQETPGRYPDLRAILRAAERGDLVLVASSLVLAEVSHVKCHGTTTGERIPDDVRKIQLFFDHDYIKLRNVDRAIATEAARLWQHHGIKPQDAIHLATAMRYECECFQTYDGEKGEKRKLLKFDGKIGTPPLKIEEPANRWPEPPSSHQASLFEGSSDV